jgi:uncharacterized protein (TIGR03083 family)
MSLDRGPTLAGIPDELRDFTELVGSLTSDQLHRPTRCDGWAVADVAGHVIGVVVDVTEGRLEGQGTAPVNERQAKERAGRTGAELADELSIAAPRLSSLLESLPPESWDGPSFGDPRYTLGFAVEAIWFDTYLHADDIRAAIGAPSLRSAGLRCAVHHVAGYLEQRGQSLTLDLDGIERIDVGGGGQVVHGDPLTFVLAATGRGDPAVLGLDETINVYGS